MNTLKGLIHAALLTNEILHQDLQASGRRGVGGHTTNLDLPAKAFHHKAEATAEFARFLGRLSTTAENPSICHGLSGFDGFIEGGTSRRENLPDQQADKQGKGGVLTSSHLTF